jgi:hypothetical protein
MTARETAAIASKVLERFHRGEPRHEVLGASFGKWSQAGVPHRGWTCIGVDDLEEPDHTCEMCEHAEVRYVHVMTHPDYGGGEAELLVGCICAGRMEEDYQQAKEREAEFKRRQKPAIAEALMGVEITNKILAYRDKLKPKEEEFVEDMRSRAARNATPRIRKRYAFSPKQMRWLEVIYQRIRIQEANGSHEVKP